MTGEKFFQRKLIVEVGLRSTRFDPRELAQTACATLARGAQATEQGIHPG